MPPVTLPAAPLVGGVSRQPPTNRAANQFETCDNTLMPIYKGLRNRFGTEYISSPDTSEGTLDLSGTVGTKYLSHWIDRDSDERFLVLIDTSQSTDAHKIQVFDMTGDKKTVNITDASALTYLASGSGDSKDRLFAVTSGDTTFLVNKTVTVARTGSAPDYDSIAGAGFVVAQSEFSGDYAVPYGGSQERYLNLLTTNLGYQSGWWHTIATTAASGGDFTTSGTFANDAGPWWERVEPELDNNELDNTTMPVQLVYDPSTGEFSLSLITYDKRLSGDESSNPAPSFVGQTIQTLALFQDRIWIGAGPYVVSSQTGDLFNFWIDDVYTLTDSDPIDLTLSGSGVHRSRFLVPFDKSLLVIADTAKQYEIKSAGDFTPSDTNLIETTSHRVSEKAVPVRMGNQLYYSSRQGEYDEVKEYFYNFDRDANLEQNISAHIPEYLPKDIRHLAVSQNTQQVFALSDEEPYHIYCYTSYWEVVEKKQSAWNRFVFDSDLTILSFQVYDTSLYICFKEGSDVWLESMPLTKPANETDAQGSLDFTLHMDRKVSETGSYSAANNETTWTLDFLDDKIDTLVLGAGFSSGRKGNTLSVTFDHTGGTTVATADGDWSDYPCFFGKSWDMSVQLSRPYIHDEQGQTVNGNLQLRRLTLQFEDTVSFDVEVSPNGRPTQTRRYFASRVGAATVGNTSIKDFGQWSALIMGNSRDTTVTLKSSTPYPITITNLAWDGTFVPSRNNPTKH